MPLFLQRLYDKISPVLAPYKLVFLLVFLFSLLLALYSYISHQSYAAQVTREKERAAITRATTPAWDRKVETQQELRLGLITDLRLQVEDNYTFASDVEDRYYAVDKYMKPFAFFRSQMESYNPAYIVSLGNAISGDDQDRDSGSGALKFFRAQLLRISAPVIWVIGNREMRALTRTEFQEATESPTAPYTIDNGDYRIVVLDTNNTKEGVPFDASSSEYGRGALTAEQLVWLEEELKTSKRVVVFMHHGSFAQSVPTTGKKNDKEKSLYEASKLRKLFAQYNVSAVFMGHLRAHAYENNEGVEYFALEDFSGGGHRPGAFYELTMRSGLPHVEMYFIDEDEQELISQPYKKDVFIVEAKEE